MQFTWAINNLPASAPVPTSGTTFPFAVPGTLIAVLFAAGTYDKGDVFTVNADGSVTFVGNGSGSVSQTAGVDATTFMVAAAPRFGGAADYLSVWGGERGTLRQPNEQTDAYRARIRNIPDAVTPFAISQTVQSAAQQLGLPPFLILEPFNDGAIRSSRRCGAFRASLPRRSTSATSLTIPSSGLQTLDRRTATAYFEVVAQDYVTDAPGFEMFFDDGGYFDDPVLGYPEDTDQPPPQVLAALLAMIQDVGQKKAGGVTFDVYLKGPAVVTGQGSSSSASPTQVFTITPAGGEIWYVTAAYAGRDAATADVGSHHLVYDLEGGGSFTTADYAGSDTQRAAIPSQRVTAIHGFVTSDGSVPVHLFAWFELLAMAT